MEIYLYKEKRLDEEKNLEDFVMLVAQYHLFLKQIFSPNLIIQGKKERLKMSTLYTHVSFFGIGTGWIFSIFVCT